MTRSAVYASVVCFSQYSFTGKERDSESNSLCGGKAADLGILGEFSPCDAVAARAFRNIQSLVSLA